MSCVEEDSSAPSLPLFLFICTAFLVYTPCSLHCNKLPNISCPRLCLAAEHENYNGKQQIRIFCRFVDSLKNAHF